MSTPKRTHSVVQHRSVFPGIEAMTMFTEHAFPRHSHDQFGIGIMTSGAQRSWSVIGEVESQAGDVIMVNPGEMHDGAPMGGARGWRIIPYSGLAIGDGVGDHCHHARGQAARGHRWVRERPLARWAGAKKRASQAEQRNCEERRKESGPCPKSRS